MNLTPEDVLTTIAEIQYLYGLKYEIRYAQNRHQDDTTESVAEHTWGMSIIATYFLPLENPEKTWDRERIFEMINWHDIDEVETGDTIGFLKTDAIRAAEGKAAQNVVKKAPLIIQDHVAQILEEYAEQKTIEARFVKAIDKIEPVFHLLSENGKQTMLELKTQKSDHIAVRQRYVETFPVINQFHIVTLEEFEKRGCFVT